MAIKFDNITGFLNGNKDRAKGGSSGKINVRPSLNNIRANLLNKNIARTNKFGVTIAFEGVNIAGSLQKLVKEKQANLGSIAENITQAISSPRNAIDFFQRALTNSLSGPMSNNKATLLLHFSCYAATIPGQTLATTDVRTYGPSYKMPYNVNYQDLNLEFYCNGDMEQKHIFDYWLTNIQPPGTYDMKYQSDYKCKIFVTQFKETPKLRDFLNDENDKERFHGLINAGISIGSRFDSTGYVDYARQYLYDGSPDPFVEASHTTEIFDAYPVSVDPLSTSWEDSNDLHRLKVSFAYRYFTTNHYKYTRENQERALTGIEYHKM